MKQYSHIVADSICDYHIVGGSLTHPAHMGVFFMGSQLQAMNGQNKLALWAERVSACRSSDLSVRDWCKEIISVSQPITGGRKSFTESQKRSRNSPALQR
jgi:hypothetical protein